MSRLAGYWLKLFKRQGNLGIYWPDLPKCDPNIVADRRAVDELQSLGLVVEKDRHDKGSTFVLKPSGTNREDA